LSSQAAATYLSETCTKGKGRGQVDHLVVRFFSTSSQQGEGFISDVGKKGKRGERGKKKIPFDDVPSALSSNIDIPWALAIFLIKKKKRRNKTKEEGEIHKRRCRQLFTNSFTIQSGAAPLVINEGCRRKRRMLICYLAASILLWRHRGGRIGGWW